MDYVGYLQLVLHAHLPFVRHPEHERFFEERWFFEALTECYIPLLRMFKRLQHDGVPFRLTVSLSPTLLSMFEDDLLRERYLEYLALQIELAHKEIQRTRNQPSFAPLARFYLDTYTETQRFYLDDCRNGHPETVFRDLSEAGHLELITCAATHGFMPLLQPIQSAVHAQIAIGRDTFQRIMGSPPCGIWLPECGYYPGLEQQLRDAQLRYFFLDVHGITQASPPPPYGIMAPVLCPNEVAAFGRDPESSEQVWSGSIGYPGDYDYREYYRDIGYDLDLDYIAPYILDGTHRINTGFKYHRITQHGADDKEPYDPARAHAKAQMHARHFIDTKEEQIRRDALWMDRPPCITAPYDAELFGHWWFEGPLFIEHLIRETARRKTVRLATPSDYLEAHGPHFVTQPAASTWGHKGYNEFWLSETNDFLYPHLLHAARTMEQLARQFHDPSRDPATLEQRALRQAARNILLAQASDWPFIMKTGTNVDYAFNRVRNHLARFHYIEDAIKNGTLDAPTLHALEELDAIFQQIDIRAFVS